MANRRKSKTRLVRLPVVNPNTATRCWSLRCSWPEKMPDAPCWLFRTWWAFPVRSLSFDFTFRSICLSFFTFILFDFCVFARHRLVGIGHDFAALCERSVCGHRVGSLLADCRRTMAMLSSQLSVPVSCDRNESVWQQNTVSRLASLTRSCAFDHFSRSQSNTWPVAQTWSFPMKCIYLSIALN